MFNVNMLTVDQPQVKGAHVRFKKLVQIGESRFFPLIYLGFFIYGKSLLCVRCIYAICCVFDSLLYPSAHSGCVLFQI